MKKHLAVFTDKGIRKILKGEKTVDARFSLRRIIPFGALEAGDLIYMKRSGGNIVGQFVAERVISFDNLSPEILEEVRRVYNKKIKEDKYFWVEKREAKYGTLIFISEVQGVLFPIQISKRDRRSWVLMEALKKVNGEIQF